MVEKTENNPNTKPPSQEEVAKQAEQLAKEIKKLKSQEKKKTTPSKTEEKKTFEEELEEQLTDEEIENFQIAKVDMDKLTNKVTEILAKYESKGMLQSEL